MLPTRLSVLAMLALLAACGEKADTGPERKTAAGEVLGGSISDAMLPLDTVQSQSPPLRETAAGDDDGDAAGSTDDSADGADSAEPAAAPSPAEEPSAGASASATPQPEN